MVGVYECTRGFWVEERYGLQAQIRRAAVSASTNIVEGWARATGREYAQFLRVALGSASEVRYLLGLSRRLRLVDAEQLEGRYDELVRGLQKRIDAVIGES